MTLSETINVLIHSINELTTTLARIDENLEHQAKTVERIAEKMDILVQNVANDTANAMTQNRETSPSPLLFLPDKTDKDEEPTQCAHEEIDRLEQSFEEFWEAYGYKRQKIPAWKAWKAKTFGWESRKAAFEGIAAYKADCEAFGRPMCHAATYLHQRRWEDDFNQGLEQSKDYIDGKRKQRNIITEHDRIRRQREQAFAEYAAVAAEFRSQSGR